MRFDWTQGVNKHGIVIMNDYRELIEHFWKLKALYNLKKNIQSQISIIIQISGIQAYKKYENY